MSTFSCIVPEGDDDIEVLATVYYDKPEPAVGWTGGAMVEKIEYPDGTVLCDDFPEDVEAAVLEAYMDEVS